MSENPTPHRRRPRYSGKNPRRFEEKYKEHDPARYAETVAKVLASGKTPAGTHRPIMVAEILEVLDNYGAEAQSIVPHLKQTAAMFDKGEQDFPKELSEQKAKAIRKAIRKIESAKDRPDLRSLK